MQKRLVIAAMGWKVTEFLGPCKIGCWHVSASGCRLGCVYRMPKPSTCHPFARTSPARQILCSAVATS